MRDVQTLRRELIALDAVEAALDTPDMPDALDRLARDIIDDLLQQVTRCRETLLADLHTAERERVAV